MRTWIVTIVGAAFLLGTAAPTQAGFKHAYPVYINNTDRTASGALGAARNSSNQYEYIGCDLLDTTTVTQVDCWARNSAQTTIYIWRYDGNARIVAALRSLKGDSWVQMKWDGSGQITEVRVGNHSFHDPKVP